MQEEEDFDAVLDDDLDSETDKQPLCANGAKSATLADVPENGEVKSAAAPAAAPAPEAEEKQASPKNVKAIESATNELYKHEVMALFACFAFPITAAYLLHAIRGKLSRPSEGLVSDYNLTIFLLASELRPLSHMIELVKARTLFLQRTVHESTHVGQTPNGGRMADLMQRMEQLEARPSMQPTANGNTNGDASSSSLKGRGLPAQTAPDATMLVRDVRNAIQPELDALNRAVRRYEKKATVLAFQTESRLGAIDARLDDAIALAAAAAKNSVSGGGMLGWAADRVVWAMTLPLQALTGMVVWPLKTLTALLWRGRRVAAGAGAGQERGQRSARGWRGSGGQLRLGPSERGLPARVVKR
jgi:hypothetical protein